VSWVELRREGTRLSCRDFGGDGPAVVFLHGLAGHAGEWANTAAALVADHRVLAIDQRGHGRSERHPADISREAFVADVALIIKQLELAPVILVGQSMGGNTAFLTAAAYPEQVTALVIIEASPDGPAPDLSKHIQRWLDRWPVPFPSPDRAAEFFSSQGLEPGAWVAGLERRGNGLWPAFDKTVIVDCIADLAAHDYWAHWQTIRCPTLIIRGDRGNVSAKHLQRAADAIADAQIATIPNSGHGVHLDNPREWTRALQQFLRRHRLTGPFASAG
jgi:pimeloyl-ACP methyl ester carboxylesterase